MHSNITFKSDALFYKPAPPAQPQPQPFPPTYYYGQYPGRPLTPQEVIAREEWYYRNTIYLNNPLNNPNNPFYINPYGIYYPPTRFPLYTLSPSNSGTGTKPTMGRTTRRPVTDSGEEVTEDGEEEEDEENDDF
uniref:CSON008913 protein n=1 Tax=Culicoides sonorensis TaxID=179676 RepID=A0A336LFU8_CULSO